jgi:pilus assembly protein CpaE
MTATNNNRDLRLVVVDSDSNARRYIKESIGKNGVRVVGEAADAKAGLRLARGLQPDVVLIELPGSASQTIETVKKIRDELPGTGIIISSHESSPQLILSCIRAGAQELELTKAMDHVRKLLARMVATDKKRGTILSVFSAKGGIGATSVAANLGVALAARPQTKTVLVDLSFQMGDLGLMLDSPPRGSLTDAFEDGALDDSSLRSMLIQHASGVYLLTVVTNLEAGEEITRDHIAELFGTLTTLFDYVVVDVGRHLDDRTVEVLELSHAILLLSSLDLPTIRNVSRYLDIFDRLKLERERMHLIINRFHKKARISVSDIEAALCMEVFWKIPNDFRPMSLGIDGGTPAVIEMPRSKVARSFIGLAGCLSELYEEQSPLESIKTSTG